MRLRLCDLVYWIDAGRVSSIIDLAGSIHSIYSIRYIRLDMVDVCVISIIGPAIIQLRNSQTS